MFFKTLIFVSFFFKDYIARFGHGSAKLARQAQSKEKTMAKMVAGGLTEKVVSEKVKKSYFVTLMHKYIKQKIKQCMKSKDLLVGSSKIMFWSILYEIVLQWSLVLYGIK